MVYKQLLVILSVSVALISGCKPRDDEEPLTMLNHAELARYKLLREQYEPRILEAEQFKLESARVSELEKTYINDFITLQNFSIYKTNAFDDGRDRACYKGSLVNKGSEIVEELELIVNFRNVETNLVVKTWETMLIHANDEFLQKDDVALETRAAILALSGKRYPLKPNTTTDLRDNKNCMSDVFLGWSEKAVDLKLARVKLRPKLEEVDIYKFMDQGFYEMKLLENRAKEFNQIN